MDLTVRLMTSVFWIVQIVLECPMAKLLDREFPRRMVPPKFYPTPTNVTYEKGSLAILYCSVENLGTKTVVWRKQSYIVPITVGQVQFLEINRFYLRHVPYRDEWNLLIKNVQLDDAGTYECQISSTSKILRRNITLNVVESSGLYKPEISITGTRVVKQGNSIYLTCNASGIHSPPDGIDWLKNGNILTTETRGDLKIEKQISFTSNVIVSHLTICSAYMSDSGTYACRTPELLTAVFQVDVLDHLNGSKGKRGMEQEALTHGGKRNGHSDYSGQEGLHVEVLYKQLGLHFLLLVFYNFIVPCR